MLLGKRISDQVNHFMLYFGLLFPGGSHVDLKLGVHMEGKVAHHGISLTKRGTLAWWPFSENIRKF